MINKPLPNGPIEAINCIEHFASHSSNGRCQTAQAGSGYGAVMVTPGTGTPGTLAPFHPRFGPSGPPSTAFDIGLALSTHVAVIAWRGLYGVRYPRGQVWHGSDLFALISLVNKLA
jgi:hypothetical protein